MDLDDEQCKEANKMTDSDKRHEIVDMLGEQYEETNKMTDSDKHEERRGPKPW